MKKKLQNKAVNEVDVGIDLIHLECDWKLEISWQKFQRHHYVIDTTRKKSQVKRPGPFEETPIFKGFRLSKIWATYFSSENRWNLKFRLFKFICSTAVLSQIELFFFIYRHSIVKNLSDVFLLRKIGWTLKDLVYCVMMSLEIHKILYRILQSLIDFHGISFSNRNF